jgi:hypothetical protein
MEWEYMSLPRTMKFKRVPSAGKVMLMLFWNFSGPISEYYQDRGQMVTSAWYCAMLKEQSKPTIYSKHRGMMMELFCVMTMIDFI